MSKRAIEGLVEDFFEVPIALGSIANLEQATSEAVAEPVEEVARGVDVAHLQHHGLADAQARGVQDQSDHAIDR
ncbi:hypothetical protein ACMHYB_21785 [Sorangium sp. So ce1128]